MICIHHYSIIQSSFTALKILCALPIHLFSLLNPDNHWSFYCLYCLFQNAIMFESYHMWPFQIGFFDLVISIYFSPMSFHGLLVHYFLVLNNCLLVWMYYSLFVHSPNERHLGCFQILTIMNIAATNIHVQVFVWT